MDGISGISYGRKSAPAGMRRIEQQREAFVIDLPQMRVALEQHRTFEDGAFRENERILRLLIRQQSLCADFRRDGVHDAVPHRHEIHGLDSPFRYERTERGLRGGSHVVFIGEPPRTSAESFGKCSRSCSGLRSTECLYRPEPLCLSGRERVKGIEPSCPFRRGNGTQLHR